MIKKSITAALLCMALIQQATAQQIVKTKELTDPLLGLSYNPENTFFEKAPAKIYLCDGLNKKENILFVYGYTIKGNVEYYLISGWQEQEPGESKIRYFEQRHDDGVIAIVTESSCKIASAGYALSQDPYFYEQSEKMGITKETLESLVNDAIKRDIKAFGGKRKFLRKLKNENIDPKSLPNVVAEKLLKIQLPKQ